MATKADFTTEDIDTAIEETKTDIRILEGRLNKKSFAAIGEELGMSQKEAYARFVTICGKPVKGGGYDSVDGSFITFGPVRMSRPVESDE